MSVLAGFDRHSACTAVSDRAKADLGAAQIAEHGDRLPQPIGSLRMFCKVAAALVERAVGKVNAADIHPCIEELAQGLRLMSRQAPWSRRFLCESPATLPEKSAGPLS